MMHHYTAPDNFTLTAYAMIPVCLIGMIIFLLLQDAKTRGTYLTQHERKTMLFRRPLALRLSFAVITGFLALVEFVNALMSRSNLPILFFTLITGFCLLAFFSYSTGPNDIRLDGDQRTYERTVGWPWKPATQLGSFEDIKGVCVYPDGQAMLLINKPNFLYKGVVLSKSSTAASQALAEKVSREFGFPVVPYPK